MDDGWRDRCSRSSKFRLALPAWGYRPKVPSVVLLHALQKTLPPNSPAIVGYKRDLLRIKLNARKRRAKRDALLAAKLPANSPSPRHDPERWGSCASGGFQRILSSLVPSNQRFMISVYGASEGTSNNSVAEEGERSNLTARGYGLPVLAFAQMSFRKVKHNGEETMVW